MTRNLTLAILLAAGTPLFSWNPAPANTKTAMAARATAERTITGTIIIADENTPLEGVQVAVKGTKKVSGTQADGIYYIPVAESDSVLVFSHADFDTQEIKLIETNEYNISLHRRKD